MFQTDLFNLEAVDLQKLTKVIVGHDGKEAGAGWFLNQVIVKESSESKRRYVFKCNRYVLVILSAGIETNRTTVIRSSHLCSIRQWYVNTTRS